MKISDIKFFLDVCIKAGITPHLVGHRGIGKTDSVHQYAQLKSQELGEEYKVIEFRLGDLNDAGDIIGLPDFSVDKETNEKIATKFLAPEKLPREGKGIIFLDEINRANKEILQVIFGLLYGGKVGDWIKPEGYSVVVASNPNTPEYIVLDFQDSAYVNRMCHVKVEHNVKDWLVWANNNNIHPALTSFIKEDENRLMPKLTDFELDDIEPSGRAYEFINNVINVFENNDDIPENIIKEVFKGLIGKGLGIQLWKHYKDGNFNSVNIDKILDSFEEVAGYLKVLKEKNDIGTLNIYNEQLVDYLKNKDLTKNKSISLIKYLAFLPEELRTSFLGGTVFEEGMFFTEKNKIGIKLISEKF